MNEEYDLPEQTPDEAYQNYLDEFDAPRWYLEKTYPTFYKYFKERFEKFLEEWRKAARIKEFGKDYIDEIFINFCRNINYEIDADPYNVKILKDIEENGMPSISRGRMNMNEVALINLVETLFEVPESIISTFTNDNGVNKIFIGNPLQKRDINKFLVYKKITQTILVLERDYSFISGIQKKACELYAVENTSYSKWINTPSNRETVDQWRNGMTKADEAVIKNKIDEKIIGK